MVYFDQILHTYTFKHCLVTGMQKRGRDFLPVHRFSVVLFTYSDPLGL